MPARIKTWQEARQLGITPAMERKAKLTPRQARIATNVPGRDTSVPDDWEFIFTLPWAVSVNTMYVPVVMTDRRGQIIWGKNGPKTRQVLSKEARAWKAAAVPEIQAQLTAKDRTWLPYAGPVEVTVACYWPGYTGYDVDNYRKITQDALIELILIDDEQVYATHGHKRLCDRKESICIEVTVQPWREG